METGATLSECKTYRYLLWRIWNDDKKRLVFIMLNPSTAAHTNNDPTIKRCIKFAATNGYGGIVVANLFAYRATNPDELPGNDLAIGPRNDELLRSLASGIGTDCDVVLAWGVNRRIGERAKQVIAMFPGAMCLERTKNGQPKHPLFVRGDAKLMRFAT